MFFSRRIVLAYHSVSSREKSALSVDPGRLREQFQVLKGHGYRVMPLRELLKSSDGGRLAAITFDDGYEDNYTEAFPILKEFDFPAMIFVVVEKLGQKPYLSWEQIKDMVRSNLVRIGSHTMTHPMLDQIPREKARWEIEQSKKTIEARLKTPVESFCYPAGHFNQEVCDIVKTSGYDHAVFTPYRWGLPRDPINIERVGVYGHDTPRSFKLKCSRVFPFMRSRRFYWRMREGCPRD